MFGLVAVNVPGSTFGIVILPNCVAPRSSAGPTAGKIGGEIVLANGFPGAAPCGVMFANGLLGVGPEGWEIPANGFPGAAPCGVIPANGFPGVGIGVLNPGFPAGCVEFKKAELDGNNPSWEFVPIVAKPVGSVGAGPRRLPVGTGSNEFGLIAPAVGLIPANGFAALPPPCSLRRPPSALPQSCSSSMTFIAGGSAGGVAEALPPSCR